MSKRILLSLLAIGVIVPSAWFYLSKDDSASATLKSSPDPAPAIASEVVEESVEELPAEDVPLPEELKPPQTALEKEILAQEAIVEERREALRILVRGERPTAPAPSVPAAEVKLGPDSPEYQAAKLAFEVEWKRLEELRRKQEAK
jgi:hypothetical protein